MVEETDDLIADEDDPRKMLTIEQVLELVPVDRTTILRMEQQGRFPRGRIVSNRRKMYFADEVAKWQRDLMKSHVRMRAR